MRTYIKGRWGYKKGKEINFFEFYLAKPVGGKMSLSFENDQPIEHKIQLNFKTM